MASLLPTVPKYIFGYLEPLSLLGGFLAGFNPTFFVSTQLVRSTSPLVANDDTSALLAHQLSNCYGLLGLLGVFILNTTSELKVVRAYLWALLIGDVGHVGFSLYAMGIDEVKNIGAWTPTIWGNTLFTVFLFLSRCLYLAGVFEQKPAKSPGRELRPRTARGKAKTKSP